MSPDMYVPCGEGLVNIRVGALIVKNGKILISALIPISHKWGEKYILTKRLS
jgi:hypothetical protein